MTDSQDITNKLRNIIKVSTRVRQDQLRTALGMDPTEFDRRIFEWAAEFGFKVDGDYVNFADTDVEGFIHLLDAEFAKWKRSESAGTGKVSLPETTADEESRVIQKKSSPFPITNQFTFRIDKKRVGIQFAIIAVVYAVLFIITFAVGDLNLTIAINQLMVASPSWLQSLMYDYTKYGYYVFGITAIGIGLLTFFTDKFEKLKPYRIMFLGLAVGYSASWFIMAYLLKPVIMRLRPYQEYGGSGGLIQQYEYKPGTLYESGGYSFPSGHATASFGMSGAIMIRVQKWVFRILLYVYAILMAFTRPYFGVHYVTDVLVGSILGLACSVGFYVLFEYLNVKGKLPEARQRVIFLIGLAIAVLSIIVDLLE